MTTDMSRADAVTAAEREVLEHAACFLHTRHSAAASAALRKLLHASRVNQPASPSSGYCERAGGCVCGGDLPRVREGCSEWVKLEAAPALADDLPCEQMSAIAKLGGAIESALDEAPVSDVLSALTGAFVGLAVELVRRQGHDVAREIKVNGGQQRDITIHAPKELGDVDVLKT
ncbi:hypothetical protein [Burkholderia cepacia]|uniref:hypothetical protein n=1 Tax=Burkholderia cepacia TaxID=292 RepID=UPI001CF5389C|nr:hypothetical protein [Burkholderia cepacia]MCA8321199.1 hypothetical protein [Burkholderia cepacia]